MKKLNKVIIKRVKTPKMLIYSLKMKTIVKEKINNKIIRERFTQINLRSMSANPIINVKFNKKYTTKQVKIAMIIIIMINTKIKIKTFTIMN